MDIDKWEFPVKLNGTDLSKSSSRIDLLSPILDLCGDEDDFVLDMHYSFFSPRRWAGRRVAVTAESLLRKVDTFHMNIVSLLALRVPDVNAESVVADWRNDLGKVIVAAQRCSEIIFTR